ncbi:MAG: hypothetical protein ACRDTU_18885 [Micromonosporaceae bacterium]
MSARSVVSGTVVIGLLLVGGYVLVRYLEDRPAFPLTSQCEVTGDSTVELESEQMAHAATIAAVGLRRDLPVRAVTVALATALQESKLRNLSHGDGDRDSIGLFQQRPSMGWGEPDELGDPRYAAGAFYDKLVRISGWQDMRVTDAAQAVQKSAHPEAYQKWAEEAAVLADGLSGRTAAAVSCVLRGESENRVRGTQALREELTRDWGEVTNGGPRSGDRLTLDVADERSGWRLAHWLVSHAAVHGVQDVSFAGKRWDSETGQWRTAKDADGTSVVAALSTGTS